MVFVPEGQHDSSQDKGPCPKPKGQEDSAQGFQPWSFLHHLSVGSPPRPIFLAPAFTHPLQSSFPLEAPLNGANGTQAGSLCYINVFAILTVPFIK
jgi:hypothetical protein